MNQNQENTENKEEKHSTISLGTKLWGGLTK